MLIKKISMLSYASLKKVSNAMRFTSEPIGLALHSFTPTVFIAVKVKIY